MSFQPALPWFSSVGRVGEHSLHNVGPHSLEEGLVRWRGERGGATSSCLSQDPSRFRVLLAFREIDERLPELCRRRNGRGRRGRYGTSLSRRHHRLEAVTVGAVSSAMYMAFAPGRPASGGALPSYEAAKVRPGTSAQRIHRLSPSL